MPAEPWQAEEVRGGLLILLLPRDPLEPWAGESWVCFAGAGVPGAGVQAPGISHCPGVCDAGAAPACPNEVPAAQTDGWRR